MDGVTGLGVILGGPEIKSVTPVRPSSSESTSYDFLIALFPLLPFPVGLLYP